MVLQDTPVGMFYVSKEWKILTSWKICCRIKKTLLKPEFQKEFFHAIFVFAIWNDTASWQTQE